MNIKYAYYENGNIRKISFEKFSMYYYENGMLEVKEYYHSNENKILVSNDKGPAKIRYYSNGHINEIVYADTKYGGYHRTNGPAIIFYNINGSIGKSDWYYKSFNYTKKVNEWMIQNNVQSYENMKEHHYNQMWMELL